MSGQLQLRRGSTAENDAFTGVEGELTYDTVKKELRVHDGVTQGGNKIPTLVAVQRPTAENNYTWYRKWSDGWVEQGGIKTVDSNNNAHEIVLSVPMADTNYFVTFQRTNTNTGTISSGYVGDVTISAYTITSFTISRGYNSPVRWEVKGMAAE